MKKKITLVATSVLLVAAMVIGGTLAYFTDTTDTKTTTFTVGNVDIELTEPAWNANESHNLMPGATFAKDPTITVAKDSNDAWVFMKVEMNKFNSWLRLLAATNEGLFGYSENCSYCEKDCQGHIDAEAMLKFFESGAYQAAFNEWFNGVNHDTWKIMNFNDVHNTIVDSLKDSSVTTVDLIFGYKVPLKAEQKVTLFTSVTMPADITSKQLADSRFNSEKKAWTLDITGYAIQADEVNSLDAAYAALFNSAS